MNTQEFFDLYLGMKAHFNTKSYDFKKYQGKLKRPSRVIFRKDRYWFEKIASRLNTKDEAISFLLANFFQKKNFWIGDPESFEIYQKWLARNGNLLYTVKQELDLLIDFLYDRNRDFNDLIDVSKHSHPALIRLYTSGTISPETATMLIIGLKLHERWLKTDLSKDFLVSEELEKLKKYSSFYDMNALLKTVEETVVKLFQVKKKIEIPLQG